MKTIYCVYKEVVTLHWILTCPQSYSCSCCHQWTLGWLGGPWRYGDTPLPFPSPDCAGSDWIPLLSCWLLLWMGKFVLPYTGLSSGDKGVPLRSSMPTIPKIT